MTDEEKKEHDKEVNRQAVAKHHEKLVTINLRYPRSLESDNISLSSMIRARAKKLGYIDKKSKDGSANGYILNLIEKDLNISLSDLVKNTEM